MDSIKEYLERSRVFVLGSGFSAGANVPLTEELLSLALKLMGQEIPDFAERIRSFYDIAVNDAAALDSTSIISNLCTLLEYNELREHGGGERWSDGGSREKLALKFYLAKALTLRTPSPKEVPDLYVKFVQQLRKEDVVLSFNWDCLLEAALEKAERAYSYDYQEGHIFIAKMHGSTHWRLRQFKDSNKYFWQRIGFDSLKTFRYCSSRTTSAIQRFGTTKSFLERLSQSLYCLDLGKHMTFDLLRRSGTNQKMLSFYERTFLLSV